jgi:hypothetical protein
MAIKNPIENPTCGFISMSGEFSPIKKKTLGTWNTYIYSNHAAHHIMTLCKLASLNKSIRNDG